MNTSIIRSIAVLAALAASPAAFAYGGGDAVAGAVIGGAEDTAAAKITVFNECGIEVAVTPSDMADALIRTAQRAGVTLS